MHIAVVEDTVLNSGTDEGSLFRAANFMLSARPVIQLLTVFPTFADSVLSDPTLGGKIGADHAMQLNVQAILFHVDATPALDAKIAYLAPRIQGTQAANVTDSQMLILKSRYAALIAAKAALLYDKQDYAEAISTGSSALGWGQGENGDASPEIVQIFRAKVALRSTDVLSWAKLVYFQSAFGQTQAGIDAVSSAYGRVVLRFSENP